MAKAKGLTSRQNAAALKILVHRLETIIEAHQKLGLTALAEAATTEKDATLVVATKLNEGVELEKLNEKQRVILRRGLKLLVHNLKAASGTMIGCGHDELGEELTAEAEIIDANVGGSAPSVSVQSGITMETAGRLWTRIPICYAK